MASEVTKVGYIVRVFFFFTPTSEMQWFPLVSIYAGVWIKGHSPFVRTGRPDLSSRKENSTIGPDYQPDQLIPKWWFARQWWVLVKIFRKGYYFIFRDRSGRQFWLLESALRPTPNIELFMRRTKSVRSDDFELTTRRLNQLNQSLPNEARYTLPSSPFCTGPDPFLYTMTNPLH